MVAGEPGRLLLKVFFCRAGCEPGGLGLEEHTKRKRSILKTFLGEISYFQRSFRVFFILTNNFGVSFSLKELAIFSWENF